MRENRPSGSEGGGTRFSLPLLRLNVTASFIFHVVELSYFADRLLPVSGGCSRALLVSLYPR